VHQLEIKVLDKELIVTFRNIANAPKMQMNKNVLHLRFSQHSL